LKRTVPLPVVYRTIQYTLSKAAHTTDKPVLSNYRLQY